MRSDDQTPTTQRIYYVGNDGELISELNRQLFDDDVTLTPFDTFAEFDRAIDHSALGLLLLDTRTAPKGVSVAFLMDRLRPRLEHPLPLICIAHSKDIQIRLDAIRAGAKAFVVSPVAATTLVAEIRTLLRAQEPETTKVLVVDDSEAQATFAREVLRAAGFEAEHLIEPLKVMEKLADFHPDLILLDLYMPDASGSELAMIIREQDQFADTPIVFLSAEVDPDKQLDALRFGGDEFIAKPVRPEHLVKAVRYRIDQTRSRRARFASSREELHRSVLMHPNQFLQRVERWMTDPASREAGSGLLFLEIDQLHDSIARIGVDAVGSLFNLIARIIKRRCRGDDLIARYADRGFTLLARRNNQDELKELGMMLCRAIAERPVKIDDNALNLTLSVGIGSFEPPADDALTVISRGQKACSSAHRNGGNRIELYEPYVQSGLQTVREERFAYLISRAIKGDGFLLMYQPIVSVQQHQGDLYEVLLRLRTPDGELIPPLDFLPVAMSRGLMPQVDRWVMDRTLEVLAQEQRSRGQRSLRFFVHQTVETLASKDWVLWLRDQIISRNLIEQRPVLQFRLKDVLANLTVARSLFPVLQKLGLWITLSGFENTPAAMTLVEDLKIALVKLSIEHAASLDDAKLTRLVKDLHACECRVIAPGVEAPSNISRVWTAGVDMIQGNFVQPPGESLDFDFREAELI